MKNTVTKTFRVYGSPDHRQKLSFNESADYDWSAEGVTRKVSVLNSDKTGTNDYTEVIVKRDSSKECYKEIAGQITDGLFENVRTGRVTEVILGEEFDIDPLEKANAIKYGVHAYDRDEDELICWYELDVNGKHFDSLTEAEDAVEEWRRIDEIDGNSFDYRIEEIEVDD